MIKGNARSLDYGSCGSRLVWGTIPPVDCQAVVLRASEHIQIFRPKQCHGAWLGFRD